MKNKPLDNLLLGYPCPVDWDSMTGDEIKRYCNQCSLNVYNISGMSDEEANKLLSENENACVRFYLRKDGTIKTDSCARYFRVVRDKFRLIKSTASFLALLLLTACTGANKSAVREKWAEVQKTAKHRYYDPDKFVGMAGRPMKSDLRKAMEVLVPMYPSDIPFYCPKEEKALLAFRQSIMKTRTIQDAELKKLDEFYRQNHNELGLFHVYTVKMLLALESPLPESEKDRIARDFENNRQKLIDLLMMKAEKAMNDDDQLAAERLLDNCVQVCTTSSTQTTEKKFLPYGVQSWQYVDGTYSQPKFLITSREKIIRLARLWEKASPAHPTLRKMKYSMELALIIEDRKLDPKNQDLEKAQQNTYEQINFIYDISDAPEIKLAKIIEVSDHQENGSYTGAPPTKLVKFDTIENIRGNAIKGVFSFKYAIHENVPPQPYARPEPLITKEDLAPPKIGDLKIVMLFKQSEDQGYVPWQHFNGILAGTPERIEKVKTLVAAEEPYHNGAYKMNATQKKFWDAEWERQTKVMFGEI